MRLFVLPLLTLVLALPTFAGGLRAQHPTRRGGPHAPKPEMGAIGYWTPGIRRNAEQVPRRCSIDGGSSPTSSAR